MFNHIIIVYINNLQNHEQIPAELHFIFRIKHALASILPFDVFIGIIFSKIIHVESSEKKILFPHIFSLIFIAKTTFNFICEFFKNRNWFAFNFGRTVNVIYSLLAIIGVSIWIINVRTIGWHLRYFSLFMIPTLKSAIFL